MPEEQVLAVAGGEPLRLSDSVRVRVFPSLHSCVWASGLGLHPAEGRGLASDDPRASAWELG